MGILARPRTAVGLFTAVVVGAGLAAAPPATAAGATTPTTATVSTAAAPSDCSTYEVVSHRGSHGPRRIAENTVPAFLRAIEQGDSIEMDVWSDADGVLWVFHDMNVRYSTTNGGDRNFENLTTSEVRQLRYKEGGGTIPVAPFQDVVDQVLVPHPGVRAYLEVKRGYSTVPVLKVLKDAGRIQNSYLTRHVDRLATFERNAGVEDVPAMWKAGSTDPARVPDGVSVVGLGPVQMRPGVVARYHDAGYEVQGRRSNTTLDWRDAIRAGADGQLTDRTRALHSFCPRALLPPDIRRLRSREAPRGGYLVIRGRNFDDARWVKFGKRRAEFRVNGPRKITAVVPMRGARRTFVTVAAPNGRDRSARKFRKLPAAG